MKKHIPSLTALATITLVLLSGILSGCNTVQGAGRDISAGGHVITRAAS